MRRHCWSALALVLGLGLAGSLAGCGGPRGFYASDPPRIPLGGNFTVQPGQEVIVYGVRSKRCGMEPPAFEAAAGERSEEHTSELQSLMRISYAVFCLKKKN